MFRELLVRAVTGLSIALLVAGLAIEVPNLARGDGGGGGGDEGTGGKGKCPIPCAGQVCQTDPWTTTCPTDEFACPCPL